MQSAQGKAFAQIKRNGAPKKNTKLSNSDDAANVWYRDVANFWYQCNVETEREARDSSSTKNSQFK